MRAGADVLGSAGIETARLEARLLLQWAGRLTHEEIVLNPERVLSAKESSTFMSGLSRRVAREPLAYIFGEKEFWGLTFRVGQGVLIPRPDSETLVEAALKALPVDRSLRVLDLGVGSGCLLLSVLSERPLATGLGVDRSERAARIARENARLLGVTERAEIVVGDWAGAIGGSFDLVLANPPYVARGEPLSPETAYEPPSALFAQTGGLAALKEIINITSRLLTPGGRLILEMGAEQGESLRKHIRQVTARSARPSRGSPSIEPADKQNLSQVEIHTYRDLAGRERCIEVCGLSSRIDEFKGQFEKKHLEETAQSANVQLKQAMMYRFSPHQKDSVLRAG